MGFISYIKKQKDRDDPCGDLSRDFLRTLENPDIYFKTGIVNEIESETLYGFAKHLPWTVSKNDEVFAAVVDIWKEWLIYEHFGLKFGKPGKGYLYFFKLKGENAFKIGKTKNEPILRKSQIEAKEKVKLYIYNWIYIDN